MNYEKKTKRCPFYEKHKVPTTEFEFGRTTMYRNVFLVICPSLAASDRPSDLTSCCVVQCLII